MRQCRGRLFHWEGIVDRQEFMGYLQNISRGMFGRPGDHLMRLSQAPTVTVYPIGLILENLLKIEEPEWASYAFSREPLNGKFSDDDRLELTKKALDCGMEAAKDFGHRYGDGSPEEIAKQLGITVSYPSMPQDKTRVMFAEFCPPKELNVFMDGLNKAKALLGEFGVANALGENPPLDQILIAHELFHYVEEQNKDIWTKTHKIKLWGIGPIQNYSKISVLSEIAAMGFCKELMKLPYMPYMLDVFFVYGYSSEKASKLYEEMMERAGIPLN